MNIILSSKNRLPAVCLMGAAIALLNGCAAFTSTTNVAADAAATISHGISKASRASTDASVTDPDVPRYAQAVEFVGSQRDPLQREAARGGGEHVDTLAQLLDTPNSGPLGPWLQTHYQQVFAADRNATAVVDDISARRS